VLVVGRQNRAGRTDGFRSLEAGRRHGWRVSRNFAAGLWSVTANVQKGEKVLGRKAGKGG